eukprot:TRINITY_DN13651_c0_g1_i2.p1 TRINITY_DN13651_c0_g1~~TRINITY_DN13651_c0_g1_i2.p1  ORF type:complete len:1291 (+),score=188.31 TRINITY_DN13651_c0_g1_i2:115-3987(+)
MAGSISGFFGGADATRTSQQSSNPDAHPLETASCYSTFSVSWMAPLASKAASKSLTGKDVWEAPTAEGVDASLDAFSRAWHIQQTRRSPSVVRAIFTAFRSRFLQTACLLFTFMCVQLTQPVVIRALLDRLTNASEEGMHTGFALAAALVCTSFASSLAISAHFRIGKVTAILAKTSAMCAIYDKAVNLSATSRLSGSTGKTTNLMAVDAEKLMLAMIQAHFVWMMPVMAICSGILMAINIGISALAGLVFMFAMWPVQQRVAKLGGRARRKALAFTDDRMKFLTEVVHGIRVAKLYAWEEPIYARIAAARKKECWKLCISMLLKITVREGLLMTLPVATLAIIFGLERAQGRLLTLPQAMIALGLLNSLRYPQNVFAVALQQAQDGLVSAQRIGSFLSQGTVERGPEQSDGDKGSSAETSDAPVSIEDAAFAWEPTAEFQLQLRTLEWKAGSKVAVLGRVGSGKSSLLSALFGEMMRLRGSCLLRGRVAYLGQTPWIQNASVRDNILFGLPMDDDLYYEALEAAVLGPDLATLSDGDQTDIGERGINLSGGQKARVGLARCLYASASNACDVVVLDSPFAALDVFTGQKAFEGVQRLTEGRLVICVMASHLHLLKHFDQAVVMDGGSMVACGPVDEVKAAYPELLASDDFTHTKADADKVEVAAVVPSKNEKSAAKLMKQDKSATENRQLLVLAKYLGGTNGSICGCALAATIVIIFGIGQGCRVGSDLMLMEWASGSIEAYVPFALAGSLVCMLAIRVLACTLVAFRATVMLHDGVLWKLLCASVPSFFDVTTSGEICNKLSKDLEGADVQLPEFLLQAVSNSTQLVTIFVLNMIAVPWFGVVLVPMALMFAYLSRRFGHLSRTLKRLEGASRSPIYSSFSETLSGLETIRAWGAQKRFREGHMRRVRHNLRFFHAVNMSEIWVMIRLELLTVFVIGSFSFTAVASQSVVNGELVALALVYAIQMTAMFQRTSQVSIQISQLLTACERVLSLGSVPQEAPGRTAVDLPSNWPQGSITFDDVSMKYRDGDLVLKGVTFSVPPGTRVGICGRTGAGKSSLISALFRVVEPCSGLISIDGFNISSLGVHTLRRHLAIIPQEPVIFSGSLRSNLDPFGQIKDDADLETELKRVGLGKLLSDGGLDMPVAEHGGNLSQGQRQLLCIARAILKQSRVMVLDEATSSVDLETDADIQRAITEYWASGSQRATILTIAHRLSTIADYEKILVLSFGQVVEYDSPQALVAKPDGHFRSMMQDAQLLKMPQETKADEKEGEENEIVNAAETETNVVAL